MAISIVHSIQTRPEHTLAAFFISLTVNGDLRETSSSCRKDLVGECTGAGEMHTCSLTQEGEEPEGLSLGGRGGGCGRVGNEDRIWNSKLF